LPIKRLAPFAVGARLLAALRAAAALPYG
jgi:hypothetical protein